MDLWLRGRVAVIFSPATLRGHGLHRYPVKENRMKWVTREKAKVDRIACPWLIKRFVDKSPEFLFVPPETIPQVVKDTGAIAYDAKGVELTHYKENGEERVSFDAIIKKYKLTDPALLELA